ncbi:GntR family transcriptional regulator [Pikeienuella sp. HZG-20]|uniref:GntR family transcriptional regulator n=1 Tax=Paludibacillus litoralis TaxID=3133267 RepID=UPI0030EC3EA1
MQIEEAPKVAPKRAISTIDALVDGIVEDVRIGQLTPGQRLLEADLAERFNVGRGTVREAIRRLSGEGLIQVNRFRGASIRMLSDKEVLDVLATLELMLGLAARQAAKAIDNGENRELLQRRLGDLLALEGSSEFYVTVRHRELFFNTIVYISGNQELDRLMPRLQLLIARLQMPNLVPDAQRFADYRMMGEAILSGEEGLAEYVARLHMRHSIEAFKITMG